MIVNSIFYSVYDYSEGCWNCLCLLVKDMTGVGEWEYEFLDPILWFRWRWTPAPRPLGNFWPHILHLADSNNLILSCLFFMCLLKFWIDPIVTSHEQQYTDFPSGKIRSTYKDLTSSGIIILWRLERWTPRPPWESDIKSQSGHLMNPCWQSSIDIIGDEA
jgi:hypothetical protein